MLDLRQMERTDKISLGIASAGHVLLFGLLSTSWLAPDPLKLANNPIEVSIADDIALRSSAPRISELPPPPAPGEVEGPPELAKPEPTESVMTPDAAPPKPAPAPVPAPKPEPRKPEKAKSEPKKAPPTPAKATQSRGSKLKLDTSDWAKSSNSSQSDVAEDAAIAAEIGPAQKSALDAEIRRQLKPHWKAPTGADVEQLRTIVTVKLARDGSIVGSPQIIDTLGVTASNRTQVRLHQEQAVRAIRLAAPFNLPPKLYSGWNYLRLTFDKRLSQ
ncbi:MAG: TonB C-terminal domain-containing protein [Sphingobium sp.]